MPRGRLCVDSLQFLSVSVSLTVHPLQYSINKSKQTLGYVGPEWEQRIVAELDSALNKWIDTVPEHRVSINPALLRAY